MWRTISLEVNLVDMEGSNVHSQKRQRTENEKRSAKLLDLDVLDCPVCFEPLTISTFQCDDRHLVCFAKVSNKCPGPACNLPIGNKQCSSIERVLKSVFVPCRNAEFDCKESFSYGQVSSHKKEWKASHILTYESPELKNLLEVSSQSPEESFMFVPNSLLRGDMLEMKLRIKK